MTYIRADELSVEKLLSSKYDIDEYQREYSWEDKHVKELLNDLFVRFWSCFDLTHERTEVDSYKGYYLGAVIVSHRDGTSYIVDGQQRLTTLTLLLIHLLHLQRALIRDESRRCAVAHLIASSKYGQYSFNLNIPEREECLRKLMNTGDPYEDPDEDESVQTMLARYADIVEHFPEELRGEPLAYFVDWLVNKVMLVQISTDSDDDAYIIFETMNDRGKTLAPSDMLKGYLLSQVPRSRRVALNDRWRQHMTRLNGISREEGADFLKHWLRARYADSIRDRSRNALPRDWDLIGTVFHRWVRDNQKVVGLETPDDYVSFLQDTFPRYADQYMRVRRAEQSMTQGLEAVYYNAQNSFTLQHPILLAPIRPDDKVETANRKISAVATYLDIYIARRAVNNMSLNYSTIVYAMFLLIQRIRHCCLEELVEVLNDELQRMDVTFDGAESRDRLGVMDFRLNNQSKRYIRHILARITSYIEEESEYANRFPQYANQKRGEYYEIEHLWPDRYADHEHEYRHPDEFQRARNRVGGLVLVTRQHNRSYGDKSYPAKVQEYVKQNYLARSLHPDCYKGEPRFLAFMGREQLPFEPYQEFGPNELEKRSALYLELCKLVWSPERIARAAGL